METTTDGCPTGILIDIGLQTNVLRNMMNENEKNQVSIKNGQEKNIVAIAGSSHPWASDCLLDQSPVKHPQILQTNMCFTPKSSWKTPSPKSMKIITREASRIVDQLYSSPINCSEAMICDEVFPTIKSLDDFCFDENHIKSKNVLATDENYLAHEKVDQSNPDSFNLADCTISAVSSSKSVVVSDENISTTKLPSDMKPTIEHDPTSEKINEIGIPENIPSQKSNAEFFMNDRNKVKSLTSASIPDLVSPESTNALSNKLLTPEHEITAHKKKSFGAKRFIFNKLPLKPYAEENELLANGSRQAKIGRKFPKTERSCSSSEVGSKETNIRKNHFLMNESIVPKSSKKNIIAKYPDLEKKRGQKNQILEDNLSKSMIGKPEALIKKSNIVRSQSLLCKKDPFCKTAPLLETPIVASSARRFNSFHAGSSKNVIPTVEKKTFFTTDSSSRVLKPKMSLNQVSNNGLGYSTPLQFGKYSQSLKPTGSSAANPTGRKSFAFGSDYSSVVNNNKVSQYDQHNIIKRPVVTSSRRLGFEKKLNMPSSHAKLKNDSLSRKLFP